MNAVLTSWFLPWYPRLRDNPCETDQRFLGLSTHWRVFPPSLDPQDQSHREQELCQDPCWLSVKSLPVDNQIITIGRTHSLQFYLNQSKSLVTERVWRDPDSLVNSLLLRVAVFSELCCVQLRGWRLWWPMLSPRSTWSRGHPALLQYWPVVVSLCCQQRSLAQHDLFISSEVGSVPAVAPLASQSLYNHETLAPKCSVTDHWVIW